MPHFLLDSRMWLSLWDLRPDLSRVKNQVVNQSLGSGLRSPQTGGLPNWGQGVGQWDAK